MSTITGTCKVQRANGQVSVTIETDLAEVIFRSRAGQSLRSQTAKPRIFVWGNSEESIIDDLVNRQRRPAKAFRAGAKAAFADAGIDFDFAEMYWDQRAGCSCPCSPGFIARRQIVQLETPEGSVIRLMDFDVYVTLKTVASV